jgi:hydroxymethylpyrimidine pyrophosphatase-like HAD family hydrolase
MNDSTAFKDLGAGIAMGNASKEVKSHASFITTHYKKNGLINALNGDIKVNNQKTID